jgi:hypothetical protein
MEKLTVFVHYLAVSGSKAKVREMVHGYSDMLKKTIPEAKHVVLPDTNRKSHHVECIHPLPSDVENPQEYFERVQRVVAESEAYFSKLKDEQTDE